MKNVIMTTLVVSLLSSGSVLGFQSQNPDKTVIIYNNFGYFIENRTLNISNGSTQYEVDNLPLSIIPASVFIEYNIGPAVIKKQELDPAVFNFNRMLDRHKGKEIVLNTESGTIRGLFYGINGSDYILLSNNNFLSVSRSRVNNFSIPAEGTTPGFTSRFLLEISSSRNTELPIELNYLANGIGWTGEYVGVYNDRSGMLRIRSWAKITNSTGIDLLSDKILLIVGEPNKIRDVNPSLRKERLAVANMQDMSAVSGAVRQEAGIYHIYSIDEQLEIRNGSEQQIKLFDEKEVAVEQKFIFSPQMYGQSVVTLLEFENDRNAGFGEPMALGNIRIFQKNGDTPIFLGEDFIKNTPVNEKVTLNIGNAFDLSGAKTQTNFQSFRNPNMTEESYEIKISNASTSEKQVHIQEIHTGNWRILENSHEFEKKSSSNFEFIVQVPGEGSVTVNYKIRKNF